MKPSTGPSCGGPDARAVDREIRTASGGVAAASSSLGDDQMSW